MSSVVLVLSATVLVLVLERITETITHFYPRTTRSLSALDRLRGVLVSDHEIAWRNKSASTRSIAALRVLDAIDDESNGRGTCDLKRIVSMLTRLIQRTTGGSNRIEYEYEYEYRDAEYEYEPGNQTCVMPEVLTKALQSLAVNRGPLSIKRKVPQILM